MSEPRFGPSLAIAGALVIAVAIGVWSLTRAQPGLPVSELLSVERFESEDESLIEGHMRWSFEVIGGEREVTEADLEQRFAPSLAEDIRADDFSTEFFEFIRGNYGRIQFVRFIELRSAFARGLGVGDNGVPLVDLISMSEDGRIVTWSLFEDAEDRRLPLWLGALEVFAATLFGALGTYKYARGDRGAWPVLIAGSLSIAGLLVLSQSSLIYTIGRVTPMLVLLPAVWIFGERLPTGSRRLALVTASAAAAIGVVAPLTRDSTLIGHPGVFAGIADSASLYRGLLGGGSFLTGLALSFVAASMVKQLGSESPWRRPPESAALLVVIAWAFAAFAAALDYAVGTGAWAGGGLQAVAVVSLAAVPIVLAFRLVTARWDQPELAGLVVELGSGGDDLRVAVARALEDPTIELLVSPDGARLLDEHGREFKTVEDLNPGRALTQIQFNGRLVGGLVHDAALRGQPDRLHAVAAALGPALDVSRLTGEIEAQLAEVQASRRRIIEASDDARRRVERDLHDGAQQRLVALGIELQRGKRLADGAGQPELAALLQSMTAEVRGTIEDIRSVARGSHPALLVERGLAAGVDALAERSPIPVQTDITTGPLPGDIQLVAYYVVAEGLANVAKHAATATRILVTATRSEREVLVEVLDDGDGGAVVARGSGLQGLDDRVAAVGGTFEVSSDQSGTRLTAVIPCA